MKKHAFPLQLAKEAVLLELYPEALSLVKPLSEDQANPDAQFLHAYLHFWDDELSRDNAVKLMTRVADKGHVEANYILAVCPDLAPSFTFTLPNTKFQLERLRYAADNGSYMALTDLAECYLKGVMVQPDLKFARKLLMLACEQSKTDRLFTKSYLLLGKMLLEGVGDPDWHDGLTTLMRCPDIPGDPYASEACVLLMNAAKAGDYDIQPDSQDYFINHAKSKLEIIDSKITPMWQRYLSCYCSNTFQYDIRDADFDVCVDFVFDHFFNPLELDRNFRWHYRAKVRFNPKHLLQFYTRLFENPGFLLDHYSNEQIAQGLVNIRDWENWTVGCVMVNPENTVDEAEACIRSMYGLFEHLFSHRGALADTVGYMWWDIGYGACSGDGDAKKIIYTSPDSERLYQAEFETMVRVLQLPFGYCHEAAIHGLGHRTHSEKEKVLRQYLNDHPDLPGRLRLYVLDAIAGNIM